MMVLIQKLRKAISRKKQERNTKIVNFTFSSNPQYNECGTYKLVVTVVLETFDNHHLVGLNFFTFFFSFFTPLI